jgi:hypothetical protein
MQKISLAAAARQQLDRSAGGSDHATATVRGGHERCYARTLAEARQAPALFVAVVGPVRRITYGE